MPLVPVSERDGEKTQRELCGEMSVGVEYTPGA
jgi:hypothetical protein